MFFVINTKHTGLLGVQNGRQSGCPGRWRCTEHNVHLGRADTEKKHQENCMGKREKQLSGILSAFVEFTYTPNLFHILLCPDSPHPFAICLFTASLSSFGSFSLAMLCPHYWSRRATPNSEYQPSTTGSGEWGVTAHLWLRARSRLSSLPRMSLCFVYTAHRANSEWQGKS